MKIAILNRKEGLLYTLNFPSMELIDTFVHVTGIQKENFDEVIKNVHKNILRGLRPNVYSVLHKGIRMGGIFGIDYVKEMW